MRATWCGVFQVRSRVPHREQVLRGLRRLEFRRRPLRALHIQRQELQPTDGTGSPRVHFLADQCSALTQTGWVSGVYGENGEGETRPDDRVPPDRPAEAGLQVACS